MTLKNTLSNSRFDLRLIIVLITYIILAIILFRYYQYMIGYDGIQYITIAKSYMTGNFFGSIDDYWSPLISWLLIPFLLFTKTPVAALHAIKILTLTIGFFTIIGIRQLSYRFEMDEVIRTILLFIMVPVVLYFALSVITPDILTVCILVYYLAIIFNLNYPNKWSNGVLCGIFGGLAYLTKSYGFTFFIANFFILNLFQYFRFADRIRRKNVFKNFVLGFAVFLLISGAWISLISNMDHKFTIGMAGEINYELVGPHSNGMPELNQGITNPGQVNPKFALKPWSPFSSWNNFKYQLHLILNNTIKVGGILNYFSYLSLLIILVYIIMCIQPPRKLITQNEILYPLVTIFTVIAGYVMILVEERYIWIINVLLILMGGYLINLLFKKDFFNKNRFRNVMKTMILLIFAFSFIYTPVNYTVHNFHTGEDIYNLSNTLIHDGVHGKVATNDRLAEINLLDYYMNITSYGQAKNNITSNELLNELNKNDINYYFIWDNSNQSSYLKGYKKITINNQDLSIYIIK